MQVPQSPQRNQSVASLYDGVVRKSLFLDHEGEGLSLHALTHQDCAAILDHNREVMLDGGTRSGSFGKVELCIPELVLAKIKRRYPDMESPDREIRLKAWKDFIASPESKPWKVSKPRYV